MKTILLVPAAGDPHGLLREGPCGATVPMAHLRRHKLGDRCWDGLCGRAHTMAVEQVGLVLAWDGAVVREGRDRLAVTLGPLGDPDGDFDVSGGAVAWVDESRGLLVIFAMTEDGGEDVGFPVEMPADCPPALVRVHALATVATARGLGTVVVLP